MGVYKTGKSRPFAKPIWQLFRVFDFGSFRVVIAPAAYGVFQTPGVIEEIFVGGAKSGAVPLADFCGVPLSVLIVQFKL